MSEKKKMLVRGEDGWLEGEVSVRLRKGRGVWWFVEMGEKKWICKVVEKFVSLGGEEDVSGFNVEE